MPDQVSSESPLVRFDLAQSATKQQGRAGVQARERSFLGYLNLRGDANNMAFVAAVRRTAGGELPIVPNTISERRGNTIYWLGPDEWLIVTSEARQTTLAQEMRDILRDVCFAVTDISSGLTCVVLSGSSVCELLSKECPLDFDIQSFALGTCAQSKFAKAPVLIRRIDCNNVEVVIRRSFAEYFCLWLEDASAEYGFAVSA